MAKAVMVEEFGDVPAAEPHLDLVGPHLRVRAQRRGQLLCVTGERARARVPAGPADVQRLGDGPHGERAGPPGLLAQPPQVRDPSRQPVARIALGQPAVAAGGPPAPPR
ncbi:hypothetical protein AB0K89_06360 [Streptomyces cinnamoneus]|uniref:hypothetical protein n=1 Tax=Streptomyces cinnamoneus TaxID=53446 RepID=UPI0034320E4B